MCVSAHLPVWLFLAQLGTYWMYQSIQRNLEAAAVFSAADLRVIRRFCTTLCHIQSRTRYEWQRNPVSLRTGRRKTSSGPNPRREYEVIGSMIINTFTLLRQYSTVINTAQYLCGSHSIRWSFIRFVGEAGEDKRCSAAHFGSLAESF